MRHRRCISAILMSFVLFLQPAYAVPSEENQPENSQENNTENEKRQQEQISAPSAILMEASTGQIIYEKNPDEKLPPASVTKVMTLLLIFDALDSGQIKLGDEVTTSEYAASMGGSQVFLEPGETQTVDTLIKCISVASANDACVTMAEYICGNEEEFVTKMNKRAKDLGMKNTHFVNASGLFDENQYTTPLEMAMIMKYAMSNELCAKVLSTYQYTTAPTEQHPEGILLTSTMFSRMYGTEVEGVTISAGKTGYTDEAKCCLVSYAEKDGHHYIAVTAAADYKWHVIFDDFENLAM